MSQDTARGNGVGAEAVSRSNRITVLAFLSDAVTEQVVNDGLSDVVPNGLDLRRGTIRTAIGAMAKLQTPEILIVDLSGEAQPGQALNELSEVVEPGVRVLAIGDTDDVDFYRHITRGLGVMEYIFKPITRESIARHFVPLITHKRIGDEAARGGRVVAVIGAKGGVGATCIATNLAWYLGVLAKRHTVFVETDLHLGAAALALGGKTGPGLRNALEMPERIDPQFVEQAAQPISARLHLLASEEKLGDRLNYAPGAASRLIEALRARYNFVILDLAFLPAALNRELLEFVHHRVIVIDPTLASVRDCLRLLSLPNGPWQPQRPTLVLNRQGRQGGLTRKLIEAALKVKIDIVAPDMPKLFCEDMQDAEPAVGKRGPFREMISDLARDIGFVGGREEGLAVGAATQSSLAGLLKKLARQRG
jgi:pilus assembly protein CpaE